MADSGGPLSRLLRDAFNVGAVARDVIVRRFPRAPLGIALYDGYGTHDRVLVHGRALRDEKIPAQKAEDPRWRNLIATLRRVDADPIPHAVVRVRAGDVSQDFPTDDEGFFHGWMSTRAPERVDAQWASIGAELVSPVGDAPVSVKARVLLPTQAPRLLVISDIDDTVLQSRVTNLVAALRTMLLENAHTRLPFPGVAAFYRALSAGPRGDEHNAMFYVSSSPWNVYDVIAEFLQIQGIPHGPLLLRDVDIAIDALSARHHHSHKREMIRRVLQTYPDASAVLIGDSGQQDPEIYRDVVHEFQGRIRAVYIRDVSGQPGRTRVIEQLSKEILEAGSTLLLTPDTVAAASHAVALGLIDPGALSEIGADSAE